MSLDKESPSPVTILPSKLPPPTGNLLHDSLESAKHVAELPCGRNALLAGIASGAGMGFIRGLTAGPMMAGHWAFTTFVFISLGSWHICQRQFAAERKKLTQVFEATMPKRTISRASSESNTNGSSTTPS